MNGAYFLRILNEFRGEGVSHDELGVFAENVGTPAVQILDEIAFFVAEEYYEGRMSFKDGDLIMNNVWCLATGLDVHFGETTYTVYLAFDGGEYPRSGDGTDVDPETKYTRPAISQFLAQRQS